MLNGQLPVGGWGRLPCRWACGCAIHPCRQPVRTVAGETAERWIRGRGAFGYLRARKASAREEAGPEPAFWPMPHIPCPMARQIGVRSADRVAGHLSGVGVWAPGHRAAVGAGLRGQPRPGTGWSPSPPVRWITGPSGFGTRWTLDEQALVAVERRLAARIVHPSGLELVDSDRIPKSNLNIS